MSRDPVYLERSLLAGVARSTGRDPMNLSDLDRARCMGIVRALLPSVRDVIEEESGRIRAHYSAQVAEARQEGARRGYKDGYADGRLGRYANPWEL